MMLSELFAVTLIPSLINPTNSGESFRSSPTENGFASNRALLNSRAFPVASSSREDETFGDDFFNSDFSPSQPIITDPILRDIYEEEKRLNLADGDFDMRSEEARELINFQRRKLQREQDELVRHVSGMRRIIPRPEGRSLFPETPESYAGSGTQINFEGGNSDDSATEYPILKPSPEETSSVPPPIEQSTTTTYKPSTGQMGFGGLFSHVRAGIGKVADKIKKPFGGAPTTTSTTTTAPPPPAPTSANMRFPDDDNENEDPSPLNPNGPNSIAEEGTIGSTPKRLNCTGFQTQYNGDCYTVLQPLPCPTGQWLIEDDETGKGRCVENKCFNERNYAWFGGQCVEVGSNKGHCHTGMVTYIFKNGEVECDCRENYLYNQRDGNCYEAYKTGPCNKGEVFLTRVTTKGALPASCVKNKCSQEGYFCNAPSCPKDRNCVQLSSPCPGGVWQVDAKTLTPACLDLKQPQRVIGNVPTLACAPGSRRDILGTCRKPSKITFS